MNYQTFLDNKYDINEKVVDPITGNIECDGKITHIRRKELELLAILASADGKIVEREKFIEIIWGNNSYVGGQGLTRAMAYLRKTLNDHDKDNPIIRTIPRRGYQLNVKANLHADIGKTILTVGGKIFDRPEWTLVKLLEKNNYIETWLAESSVENSKRMFRFCKDENHLQRLKNEQNVLRFFRSSLEEEKNILTIINWQLDEPPYYLELPATSHGSIKNWLYNEGGSTASYTQRLKLIYDVSIALASVHAINKPHLNVNHNSIYIDKVDETYTAKLGEFGFSNNDDSPFFESDESANVSLSGIRKDVIYLSPEIKRNEKADRSSDIYALGVLIYQCAIGTIPAALKTNWSEKVKDRKLIDLISECVDVDKFNRPSAQEVADQLFRIIEKNECVSEYKDESVAENKEKNISVSPTTSSSRASSLQIVDGYYLVEKIGEGGMGEIFLAEERENIQRKVALKLIKAGVDSEEILARFESERQALGMMNHINVASVYNSGTTNDGRPYFSMEYVPGENIIEYSNKLKLNLASRISLFKQVCDGVMHAHQKGIIHRDLNPNNILIRGRHNQPPIVKIIDFGVAKSLQTKLSEHTLHTQLGLFVGTPQYSSPEQMSGNRYNVDTRTDIYSMGVVLYELIYGLTPISKSEFSKLTPSDLAIKISKEEITLPAIRFNKLKLKKQQEIAELRSISNNKMQSILGNEISWIIMKCLELNPDERYASVIELKDDLNHWMKDKPIKAKKTNYAYKFKKFIRRNKAISIATSIFLTVLIGMVINLSFAINQSKKSQKETQTISEFQVKQLKNIDPTAMGLKLNQLVNQIIEKRQIISDNLTENTDTDSTTLPLHISDYIDIAQIQLDHIFFDPSIRAIQQDLSDSPLIKIELLETIKDISKSANNPERTLYLEQLVYQEKQKYYGEENINTMLSKLSFAEGLAHTGQIEKALSLVNNLVEKIVAELGSDNNESIQAKTSMAKIYFQDSQITKAEQLLLENLETSKKLFGYEHGSSYEILLVLSTLYNDVGNFDKLKEISSKMFEVTPFLEEEYSELTNEAQILHALILTNEGDYDQAIKIYSDLLNKTVEKYGSSHPSTINLNNAIANSYSFMGQFEEASEIYIQTLLDSEQIYGKEHTIYFEQAINYAKSLIPFSEFDESNRYFQVALTGLEKLYGLDNSIYLAGLDNYSSSLIYQNKLSEAEAILLRLTSIYQNFDGGYEQRLNLVKSQLAHVYYLKERYDESLLLYNQVIAYSMDELGTKHPNTLQNMSSKANVLIKAGKDDEAKPIFEKIIEDTNFNENLDYLKFLSMFDLSKILSRSNEEEAANELLISSLEGLKSIYGENNPYTKEVQDYFNKKSE